MERYDTALIAIAISRTMICKECPYPCQKKDNSSMYNCESHWRRILDLVAYKSDPRFDPHDSKINDTK